MTLIADGGSTKCDWILLNPEGKVLLKTRTAGLNPAILTESELRNRILENESLKECFETIQKIDFYGAGCGTESPRKTFANLLQELFVNAKVSVNEDMLAAVYAATVKPGIVCILGTGSNSCFYDGKHTHLNIPSLGYILMDEASGNYFGKRLIKDFYYKKMPINLAKQFEERFNLDADIVKMNIYKEANPNAYLASFAEFIFTTKDTGTYFYELLKVGLTEFIENRVLCYKEAQSVPVHFIGSIAHFSKDIIEEIIESKGLTLGAIIRRPIDGLINYYKVHKLK